MILKISFLTWLTITRTRQDLIPPPTEPEHAPIKAPINNKNETKRGSPSNPLVWKPDVVSIETVWKTNDLKLNDSLEPVKSKKQRPTPKIISITPKKNPSSGFLKYFVIDFDERAE